MRYQARSRKAGRYMNEHRGLWRGKTPLKTNPKDAFNNVWVRGDLIESNGKKYIHPKGNAVKVTNTDIGKLIVMQEIIPETLGECTGLRDINGKLIFEGDIIKTKKYGKVVGHSNVNNYDVFVVKYEPVVFKLENNNRAFNLVDDGYSKFEVIGNIHDNPELLNLATGEDIGNAAQDTLASAT